MFRSLMALLFCLLPNLALAQEKPASPILMTMGPMDAESDQKSTVITVRYDSKPSFLRPKVEAMGSFLQVFLPNTLVPQPGVFVDAKSPYIRKFAAFQVDNQNAAIRLFVSKDAAQLAPAVSIDILENRVVIMLDHIQAEKAVVASVDAATAVGAPNPQQIVQTTEVRNDIPDPALKLEEPQAKAQVLKKAPAIDHAEAKEASFEGDMKQKMVMVAVFLACMLVLLIGLKSWRRVMSRKWPMMAAEEITMKTLATHPLGPKQKLAVIQVGNEQILLGVSSEQINFLSSLKKTSDVQLRHPPLEASQQVQRPLPKELKREQILEATPARTQAKKSRPELPKSGSSISYGIGDEGITDFKGSKSSAADQDSIEDVTKLIRKKLRDLPRV